MPVKSNCDREELAEHHARVMKRRLEQEHWTEEDWAKEHQRLQEQARAFKQRLEAKRHRGKALIKRVSCEIAQSCNGIEASRIEDNLLKFLAEYESRLQDAKSIESASQVKKHFLAVAEKAEELLDEIMKGGDGSIEAYSRNDLWRIGPLGNQEQEYAPDDPGGSEWLAGLDKLVKTSREKARQIEEKTAKGGRKTFADLLFGSPDKLLAQACTELAETHGCRSQSVVLKMVRAVQEAENGSRLSKHAGRKAVRKVAQTEKMNGTV